MAVAQDGCVGPKARGPSCTLHFLHETDKLLYWLPSSSSIVVCC